MARKLSNILNSGNFGGYSVNKKFAYITQESRMRENLMYGLRRGQGKQSLSATAPLSYSTRIDKAIFDISFWRAAFYKWLLSLTE
jgi:hypothetical protein